MSTLGGGGSTWCYLIFYLFVKVVNYKPYRSCCRSDWTSRSPSHSHPIWLFQISLFMYYFGSVLYVTALFWSIIFGSNSVPYFLNLYIDCIHVFFMISLSFAADSISINVVTQPKAFVFS